VKPGGLLVIGQAGAYGYSMASQYNARPRPAEVLVTGSEALLIRPRETYEDLWVDDRRKTMTKSPYLSQNRSTSKRMANP
jgi:hypothetical protein